MILEFILDSIFEIPYSVNMARDKIIVGLDIGTHSIKAVVAKRRVGNERVQILGVGVAPAIGVKRGVIVDIDEAATSIKNAISEAEKVSGVEVESVIVNIDGSNVVSKMSKGVVAVSRADQEISRDDIERVVRAAEAVSLPPNKEILHVIPKEFVVDGEGGIKDPQGMHGVRLELNALIIECSSPVVMNVKKCVKASGYDINNVILSPLAAAHSTLTKRQKELGVLAIDIGSATTGLAVYEDGDVIHTQILPVGSGHITNDIAIGLRIDIDMAENIKLEYGYCVPEDVSKKDTIDLTKVGHNESLRANKKEIAEIIEARLEEIFDLVNKELKKINKQSLLPAGVVLLGGGAKLPGIVDLAKKMLKLPAHVGSPQEVDGLSDYIEDPAYATAVGLVKWDADISGPNRKAGEAGFWGLVKKMLGALMP